MLRQALEASPYLLGFAVALCLDTHALPTPAAVHTRRGHSIATGATCSFQKPSLNSHPCTAGGFTGHFDEQGSVIFGEIAKTINDAIDQEFPEDCGEKLKALWLILDETWLEPFCAICEKAGGPREILTPRPG